jgi:two-component system cell cycle response regulator DivK
VQLLLDGKRIFIVEDDVTNMAVYSVILKNQGALVIQDPWNSGTIGLLRRHLPVDIIILDLMLRHRVSGYDIFREVKKEPDLAHIPVVAVSASDPGLEIPKARALGFVGFISKPISYQDFPAQLAACIKGDNNWVIG